MIRTEGSSRAQRAQVCVLSYDWVDGCCNPPAPCVSGWKFDAVFSRSGAFPAECVHPIAPPDFLSLPLDRKAEPRGGAGRVAVSSAVAVAVASTMAAHEIDQTIEVHKHTHAHSFLLSAKLT